MGNVTAKKFECDGVMTIHGNLRAGGAKIDGVITVNGSKVEADRIDCDGFLCAKGEVSADVIDADGAINAKEIVGDRIRIKSYIKRGLLKFFSRIGEKAFMKYSEIDLIEGTDVDLTGVRAMSVSGHDVTIGDGCEIERVSASGALNIHPAAKVREVAEQ
jgi:hypothetical protein